VPGQVRNFTLYVRENILKMPDGQQIYVFGYTDDPKGKAKVPGPTLTVTQGDTVNLTLVDDHDPTNTNYNPGGDGHTIHLHGLDLASQYDGDPMTAPGGQGVLQGEHYTYHFVAQWPGTFWYHCHVEAKEYTFVLSEMDSVGHRIDADHLQKGGPDMNWSTYHANYFLINGKAWPDTMRDPQDHLEATVGQTVLVRLINAGYLVHSMHSHGFHFLVVGSDGRSE
jgi:FtsP/CotA-like multicopper oxidase with cupredoxin domain